jgi:hypothetical protein
MTQRKRAANRWNALKSTGPTTARGKQASAQNAFRHGLSAARIDVGSIHRDDPGFPNRLPQLVELSLQIVECRRRRSELTQALIRTEMVTRDLSPANAQLSQTTLKQLGLALRYEREWLRRRSLLAKI